jgi:eukaryotic-like serine/threonine-protein kinase
VSCPHSTGEPCPRCSQTLEAQSLSETVRRDTDAPTDTELLQAGAVVGRYVVLERLGQGGMGVLYTARDPQLERVVAIKLLRGAFGGGSNTAGQSRLLREAQAMAQLAHPNVVPVYDSGRYGDGVFIAMELVTGSGLDLWLKQPHPWREVLALFIEAGRGLEAAHAKGLVHRDFKPANVLVGDDGRPRVTDFGLARSSKSITRDESSPSLQAETTQPITLETPLTQAGTMMGSPGYMPPEQYDGADITEASDQFAFCVSLYEGLHGVRPFKARSIPELEAVTKRGDVPPPPKGSQVPMWLHRILVQGLSPLPQNRHASMTALLAALRHDPAVQRRRLVMAAAAVVAVLALTGGVAWWASVRSARACRGAEALFVGVWDDAVKARAEQAFLATKLPYAGASWALTRDALDGWVRSWVDARVEACEAARVRGETTERQLLLQVECLDRRLTELGALAETFSAADGALVAAAGTAASRLSPLSTCANIKQLEDRKAPPPELAKEAQALSLQVAQARALVVAGRLTEARARLQVVVACAT